LHGGEGQIREWFAGNPGPNKTIDMLNRTMKYKLLNLTLAAVCCLPFAGFAQGTYLSDPSDANNHALEVVPGGWVGIGTAAPRDRLHVLNGNLSVSLGGNALIRISPEHGTGTISMRTADDVGYVSAITDANQHIWRVGGAEAMRVATTGNVGIGTASPARSFHVNGNGILASGVNPAIYFDPNDSSSDWPALGTATLDSAGVSGSRPNDTFLTARSTGNLLFGIGFTERMRLATSGNVGIGTTTPQAKLDVAGKVNCTVLELTSDRAQKSGFAPVDTRAILDQVARLPISTWHYTNDPAVTHLGPVAQDFKAAFHLGTDDKHIATVDADGVLFAAVQALQADLEDTKTLLKEKDGRIAALEQKLAAQADSFAARLAAVEKLVAQSTAPSRTALVVNASTSESSILSHNLNQENP
jgi:hypothetical protein